MKKLTIAYLIFLPITILAQLDIKNNSVTKSDLDVLYKGIVNNITISGLDHDTSLKLTSATGQVLQFKKDNVPNSFFVKADYANIDTLKVYQADTLLLTKIYEVKSIGNPVPQIGRIKDNSVTIQEILKDPTINVIIPDCYYDHGFRVIRFKTSLLRATGDTIKTFGLTHSNQLTKGQIKIINGLKAGDKIEFTEITATCNDCALRRLDPLTITIRE